MGAVPADRRESIHRGQVCVCMCERLYAPTAREITLGVPDNQPDGVVLSFPLLPRLLVFGRYLLCLPPFPFRPRLGRQHVLQRKPLTRMKRDPSVGGGQQEG